eukprot:scaffold517685_cov19-Prasinocladus_malaysianus.AAC.1
MHSRCRCEQRRSFNAWRQHKSVTSSKKQAECRAMPHFCHTYPAFSRASHRTFHSGHIHQWTQQPRLGQRMRGVDRCWLTSGVTRAVRQGVGVSKKTDGRQIMPFLWLTAYV